MQKIYELIIKSGLKVYKQNNNRASLLQMMKAKKQEQPHKQGAVFVVRTKAGFGERVQGRIVRSYEHLSELTDKATHWTPNVYRHFVYTDDERKYIAGFEERNLLQVNTFVVDIDTKKFSVNDILLACLDNAIGAPTLILESDNGYQVYFVLSTPIFISNKRHHISLKVAKRISQNLKASLKSVGADIFCNDFGFFRMPSNSNIVWQQTQDTYAPSDLIVWSQRFDNGKDLYVLPKRPENTKYTHSEWFNALLSIRDIKGHKGKIGRNNLLFTIGLACFADGLAFDDAYDLIDQVNSNFTYPVADKEARNTLESAYSGRYHAPAREHVEALLIENGHSNIKVNMGSGWYKFKKDRKDRVRSHYDEWEKDLESFLQANKDACTMSQNELCSALNIPRSTLNVLLKKSRKVFKRVEGTGRKAKTTWLTLAMLLKEIMKKVGEKRISYQYLLSKFVSKLNNQVQNQSSDTIEEIIENVLLEIQKELSTVPLHISDS